MARTLDSTPRLRAVLPLLVEAAPTLPGVEGRAQEIMRQWLSRLLDGEPLYVPDGSSYGGARELVRASARTPRSVFGDEIPTLAEVDQATALTRSHLKGMARVIEELQEHPRLRIPRLEGLEGTLHPSDNIAPGCLILSNACDEPAGGSPGRDVLLVLDVVPPGSRERTLGDDARGELVARDAEPGDVDVWVLGVHRPMPTSVRDALGQDLGPLSDCYAFWGGSDDGGFFVLHPFAGLTNGEQLTLPPAPPSSATEEGHGDGGGAEDDVDKAGPRRAFAHGERTPYLFAGAKLDEVAQLLESGAAVLEDFKVVVGARRLRFRASSNSFEGLPGALVVSGSAVPSLVLLSPMLEAVLPPEPSTEEEKKQLEQQLTVLAVATAEEYDHDRFFHQDLIWTQAMRMLGGEAEDIADLHPAIVSVLRDALSARAP